MAEKNKERNRDEKQQSLNTGGGRKGGSMEENLQQMMGQVEAPKEDAPKTYDHLSEWVEETIKDPKVPTQEELKLLKTQFEVERPEMPYDLEPANELMDKFFTKAEGLLQTGKLQELQAEVKAISSSLNELMLKGEVDLLAMLTDFEQKGAI